MSVRIETNIGDFVVDLFTEDAPKASFNFLKLCKLNYYAFSIFLRCEANFLLQGGDPSNTGKGGDSIWQLLNPLPDRSLRFFKDEIDVKKRKHALRGTLSMAAAGADKNASQFFITLADDLDFLDGSCTIFGQLTSFKSALDTVSSVDTEGFFDYFNNELFCDEGNRPFLDVFILSTVVISDPFPDPEGFDKLSIKPATEPTEAFLKNKRIGAHESLDDNKGKTEEEIDSELRDRAAKSNALILEIIGDLPSADVKPPENVLFVCKLNPITQSDDLKMIFSRFGQIVSCEVIKDRDTSSSLGYAFIEFEDKEACEQAYLKMDNVLIDDKRVKVDFSQSVAKLHGQWEDRRKGRNRKDEGDRREYREGSIYRGDRREYSSSGRREPDHGDRRGSREYQDRSDYRDADRRDSRHSRDHRDYKDSRDYRRERSRSPSYRRHY